MFLLLSGEGSTDIGSCVGAATVCQGPDFLPGPMAIVVDQIIDAKLKYSPLAYLSVGCVSEAGLSGAAKGLAAAKKGLRLPGSKRRKETGYFYSNARALASIAKATAISEKDEVVAVLFRDSDGTASAGRGLWADKRQSMLDGFDDESFNRGVPMIPRPKSEAWLLCGLKQQPYQGCGALEVRSGNDRSPNSLKDELEAVLGGATSRQNLVTLVQGRTVDIDKISMHSFSAFRIRLEAVL